MTGQSPPNLPPSFHCARPTVERVFAHRSASVPPRVGSTLGREVPSSKGSEGGTRHHRERHGGYHGKLQAASCKLQAAS